MVMEDKVEQMSNRVHNISVDVANIVNENEDISDDKRIFLLRNAYSALVDAEERFEEILNISRGKNG